MSQFYHKDGKPGHSAGVQGPVVSGEVIANYVGQWAKGKFHGQGRWENGDSKMAQQGILQRMAWSMRVSSPMAQNEHETLIHQAHLKKAKSIQCRDCIII